MLEELIKQISGSQSSLTFWEALIPILFSLLASVIAYFMYKVFYGSSHIGAGVHRTFLIGGPAITTLFLGIQTSIPLSLGLLGALSFVRFRTPVKDPAEIGFLLLLIASSIGAATKNYLVTAMLFVIVFLALGIQWLTRNKLSLFDRGTMVLAVDKPAFQDLNTKITSYLQGKLKGLKLETMSVVDNRVSLHYQYQRQSGFDWTVLTNELNQLGGAAKIELFIN